MCCCKNGKQLAVLVIWAVAVSIGPIWSARPTCGVRSSPCAGSLRNVDLDVWVDNCSRNVVHALCLLPVFRAVVFSRICKKNKRRFRSNVLHVGKCGALRYGLLWSANSRQACNKFARCCQAAPVLEADMMNPPETAEVWSCLVSIRSGPLQPAKALLWSEAMTSKYTTVWAISSALVVAIARYWRGLLWRANRAGSLRCCEVQWRFRVLLHVCLFSSVR